MKPHTSELASPSLAPQFSGEQGPAAECAVLCLAPQAGMSELSDEASESELLSRSLSMWTGAGHAQCREELDVPLDLHTASSVGQYQVVQDCIQR